MKGTRTALDLESEDMEDIALHVEELERYGTAEEFYRPEEDGSVVSSIGYDLSRTKTADDEVAYEEEDSPSDEGGTVEKEDLFSNREDGDKEAEDKKGEQEGKDDEEQNSNEVALEEESIAQFPVGEFSFQELAEDQTAVSTLGSPSLIQNYHWHPPERNLAIIVPRQEKKEKEMMQKSKAKPKQELEQTKESKEEEEERPNTSVGIPGSDGRFRGLFCTQPCGKLEVLAVILSLAAFILTGAATDRCDFAILENDHLPTFWDLPERTVGLLRFETLSSDAATTQCLYWFDYPDAADILYDGTWLAARIMSMTATFLGLLSVGFISTFSCIAYKTELFQKLAYAVLVIPLLYGLSFVPFGSDVCLEGTCEIGVGGLLMVLGVIVWLLLAAVLYMIPVAHPKLTDPKERMADAAKRGTYLGLSMLTVMVIVIVVNLSFIFGRELPDSNEDASSTHPKAQDMSDWLQAGDTTQGPYPDAHDYLSLSGDAKVISVIGKESVLTLEFDEARKLWYPFGNMIAANLDPVGWDHGDRVTKFRASAASLSEDGRVISVGSSNWARARDGGEEYEFGKVQTWKYHSDSQRWIPKGHAITGKSKGDAFAAQTKLSKDGRRLAVLASGIFGKHQPYVRVYQYDEVYEKNGNWVQLGGDIMLESFWSASGFAFSGDGSSVALGSLRIGRLGLVTVWHYDDETKTWNRRGSPISSGSSSREDQFGESVAISGNGMVLVVGDPGGLPSYARAFLLQGGEWEQLGQDLVCTADDGRCAHDVAMSKYGSTIAITGYSFRQMARVFSLDVLKEEWVQVGDDIEIAKSYEPAEGSAIELSSDGRSVALGVTFQDTQTQVWEYQGQLSLADPLEPESAEVTLGHSEAPVSAPVQVSEAPTSESALTTTLVPFSTSSPDLAATLSPTSSPQMTYPVLSSQVNQTLPTASSENATHPVLSLNETAATNGPSSPFAQNMSTTSTDFSVTALNEIEEPWVSAIIRGDIAYFLFESLPRVERYDMSAKTFIPAISLPTVHGSATALGIDQHDQMYIGYGTNVFRYSLNGTHETQIRAKAKTTVIGFHFDGDLVFINAGQYFISVDGRNNTLIKQFFSFNEMEFGTSMSGKHRRIFGRTPDEVAVLSGDIIRRSDLWFKEYNQEGDFVNEKLARLDQQVDLESASKTWMFPDQTRVVDDKGYVFSVASAEHVYTIDTPDILDIAWLGGDVMVVLHKNGSLSSISQELVVTATLDLDTLPATVAIANGEVFTFSHDSGADNDIRVDTWYLGRLKPALPGRSINATNVPFSPEFVFVDKHNIMYMLSKGHSSIFVMDPVSKTYLEPIKLDEIPRYVAYSGVNHEIYTLRGSSVLSKIDLASKAKAEVAIATLPSVPLGLSTAGEFIFVCDDSGAFATHYTFYNNGTIASLADWNHYDEEYVWSDANRKMYFFRQADPTDLMTEHIFENGTIGDRVDSFLNNNFGFEHPIRVDPSGHHALLGSGIIHNAKSLKRMNRTLSNSFLDAAFGKGFVHTIRNLRDDIVQLQQWHGHTFAMEKVKGVSGRAHRILSLSKNKTVALTTDMAGIPVAYVLDENFNIT